MTNGSQPEAWHEPYVMLGGAVASPPHPLPLFVPALISP